MGDNVASPPQRAGAARSLPSLIALIVLITIASRSVNYMVQSTTPLLAKELGFTATSIGLLSAAAAAAQLFASAYLNLVLSPAARRRAFIAASAAVPLLLVVFWASNATTIWAAAAASGLAFGIIMPNLINLPSLAPKYAERLLAIYSLSLSISLVLGPSYETWLLASASYRSVFLYFAPLAALLVALSTLAVFPPGKAVRSATDYASALRGDGFISSTLAITSYNVPFMALVNYLPIYAAEELSLTKQAAYSLFIPFFALSMLTRLLMSLKPIRNILRSFALSASITIAGMALLLAAKSYAEAAVAMAVLGIPHGSTFTLSTIMIARTTKAEERNAVNSLFSSYLVVLAAAVSPALGLLADLYGYRAMWAFALAASAASSTAFLIKYWSFRAFK
jgi:predicted MFS family arabinose efflux permease